MDATKAVKHETPPQKKRAYLRPRIIEEEVFERQVLMKCGLSAGGGPTCVVKPGQS